MAWYQMKTPVKQIGTYFFPSGDNSCGPRVGVIARKSWGGGGGGAPDKTSFNIQRQYY